MDHKKRYRWRKFPREFMVERMGFLRTERVDWLLKKRWFVGQYNDGQNYVYAKYRWRYIGIPFPLVEEIVPRVRKPRTI